MKIKQRLILLSLLEFGVWGAYLTTMGAFWPKMEWQAK